MPSVPLLPFQTLSCPKVLVTEDSPALMQLTCQQIRDVLQCDLIECNTYSAAADALSKTTVTVAVTGLNLPDAPNGQIIDLLAANDVPTILFTASVVEDFMRNYASRRLIDCIVKDGITSVRRVASAVCRVVHNGFVSVLVVDDLRTARSELESFLRRQNFRVYTAKTGRDALEILAKNPLIEIVVTDCFMPDMDGFELTEQIRKQRGSDEIRIIGVSASGDRHLSAAFLKAGASDFIYRPFVPEELQCRLDNSVEILLQLKRFRYLAERDPLTMLYNRRAFFERAKTHLRGRDGQDLRGAVAVIDLDHFKWINDNYGHAAGDTVLKSVSSVFRQASEAHRFLVARIGGEEFAFLMPRQTIGEALAIAEEILQCIREIHFPMIEGLSITASAGIVEIEWGESLDNQLNAADQMLYVAKKNGRDRIYSSVSFELGT